MWSLGFTVSFFTPLGTLLLPVRLVLWLNHFKSGTGYTTTLVWLVTVWLILRWQSQIRFPVNIQKWPEPYYSNTPSEGSLTLTLELRVVRMGKKSSGLQSNNLMDSKKKGTQGVAFLLTWNVPLLFIQCTALAISSSSEVCGFVLFLILLSVRSIMSNRWPSSARCHPLIFYHFKWFNIKLMSHWPRMPLNCVLEMLVFTQNICSTYGYGWMGIDP